MFHSPFMNQNSEYVFYPVFNVTVEENKKKKKTNKKKK
jgi:regulatory protein YycI of two-component signal transduction system YycFG